MIYSPKGLTYPMIPLGFLAIPFPLCYNRCMRKDRGGRGMKAKGIWLTVMGAVFAAALLLLSMYTLGAEVFPLDTFLTTLQRAGYEVRTDMASSEFLRGRATQITLSGDPEQTILLYQYPSPDKAKQDASCIDPSGCLFTYPGENGTSRSVTVEWVAPPHFYLRRQPHFHS